MINLRATLEEQLADSYQIERELGGGGMSRTYLALERALGRRVVIKVLAPELLAGISVERFRREVLLAAQLQHPHVVPVLSAGDAAGLPWFTMPYVDGDSLRHRLAEGVVGISETINILRDVARALSYAHRQGIVHRDIKPDNVLLSGGSATVTDFGIAKAIAASRTEKESFGATLTQIGTSIGTPTYMSPEQALGDSTTDHRTDLYAFGVMAYEMLAGRPPFNADTASRLVAAHLGETPRHISELRADCPPMLAEMVMRCLEKDPARRPQQAGDISRVLDTITSSASTESAPAILRGGSISSAKAIGIWALVSASVALTAWAATNVIGLPDWVFPGSVGIMLAGLPIILFTAYAQRTVRKNFTDARKRADAASIERGTLATIAIKASPHLSWRKTWLGGGVAVAAFAVLVIGFMVMRAFGLGSVGSLRGKGAFGDRETVIVADFRGPSNDAELGPTLAEALRTDLGQSQALAVMTRATLRDMLRLMDRATESIISFELAREIATREGAKAVLDGEVVRVGQRFVISARLVNALDGAELATFRQEASSENELLPAMGKLSRTVRERAGESLRTIRASDALERVTTSSLAALRKYVEGSRAYADEGNSDRAEALLREAVALDTSFAMAWRRLAAVMSSRGLSREERLQAISAAYRHRDRLTELERLLTEASYFASGPAPDVERSIAAYEQIIRLDSTNIASLNNLAMIYVARGNTERAEQLLLLGTHAPSSTGGVFTQLVDLQVRNGRSAASLDSTIALFKKRLPAHNQIWMTEFQRAFVFGEYDAADSIARAANARGRTLGERRASAGMLEDIAILRGRPAEAFRWRQLFTKELIQGAPTPTNRFQAVIDTAQFDVLAANIPNARAALNRGLARYPMDSMPPSERPWNDLLMLAMDLQDSSLARTAAMGFSRDQLAQEADSSGARLRNDGYVSYARGKWGEAIQLLREARQHSVIPKAQYLLLMGTAYDRAGQPDSAIAYLDQFVDTRTIDSYLLGLYSSRMHRRLGELYQDRNNSAKAVEHYNKVLQLWKNPEPSMTSEVEDVRGRVSRLLQKSG